MSQKTNFFFPLKTIPVVQSSFLKLFPVSVTMRKSQKGRGEYTGIDGARQNEGREDESTKMPGILVKVSSYFSERQFYRYYGKISLQDIHLTMGDNDMIGMYLEPRSNSNNVFLHTQLVYTHYLLTMKNCSTKKASITLFMMYPHSSPVIQ